MTRSSRPHHVRTWVLATVLALVVAGLVTSGLWRDESESADGPVTPITQTDANAPVALWVGDSYTNGSGAERQAEGYPCLVSDRFGWTCKLDAQGGTGFVNDGSGADPTHVPLAGRLSTTGDVVEPDLVVVDAGRNDFAASRGEFRQAVNAYLTDARATYPEAKFVVVLPFILGRSRFDYGPFDHIVRSASTAIDATVVDTTTPDWRRLTDRLATVDGLHPTPQSHRVLARRLAQDFRRLHLPQSIRRRPA